MGYHCLWRLTLNHMHIVLVGQLNIQTDEVYNLYLYIYIHVYTFFKSHA